MPQVELLEGLLDMEVAKEFKLFHFREVGQHHLHKKRKT